MHYDPDLTGPRHFVDAVSCAGFDAKPLAEAHDALDGQQRQLAEWRRLFLWSAGLTLPVFLLAMVLPMTGCCGGWMTGVKVCGFPLQEVLKLALTTPVQFVIGWRFHAGAYKALRNGRCALSAGARGGAGGLCFE